ncbi:MAG: dihydroneopterin aldolase [candidate division Zixibacteria bacterium]|nr:dihydroneopterin aldolase [candidate division Zixibacteria bacterium]
MKDKIRLGGMSFYGYHGITEAEKETGRMFEVDCELEVDLAEAGHTDRLKDTVNYAEVYEVIRKTLEDRAFSLLEAIACELASNILDNFPIYGVTLKVRKMVPPIAGKINFIEVEVTRLQSDTNKLLENGNNN